jgi:hypothetical protein
MLVLLTATTGASCPRNRQLINDPAPIVLSPEATLADVIRVVNANSSRIQQLQSSGATLTVAGMPPLEATYAFDRPHRFRLRAQTRITGPEVDLGSNDEIYWMWVRHSQEPAVYWGRHEEFYQSAAREILPVPPDWLIEALGVVELDPTGQHEGPFRNRPGQLELRSTLPAPGSELLKITVLDDTRGWVVEQHLYDRAQRPLASALASSFQHDPTTGVSLPRHVEIRLPAAQLHFTLQTDRHLVNQLEGDPTQLWTLPQMTGFPLVNLGRPPATSGLAPPSMMARRTERVARAAPSPTHDAAPRRLPPFDRLK